MDGVWSVMERVVTFASVAAAEFMTTRQPGLRLGFSFFRQETIPEMFGISEEHSRQTSEVQAARCSGVPCAEAPATVDVSNNKLKIIELFMDNPTTLRQQDQKTAEYHYGLVFLQSMICVLSKC